MPKLRGFLLLSAATLLSGCHFAILNPRGVIAATEKEIFIKAILWMLLIVIPVIILSCVIPWRYRAKNTKATYKPDWCHNHLLEFVWWAIPCVIIAILSVIAWVQSHELDPYHPLTSKQVPKDASVLMIEAIAMDWKWLFIYPQYHIAALNDLELPVNQPVRIFIASDAPMNSLEIPQLAGQIYAMTGMQTKLNLMATEIGTYRGLSTNFSGQGFSGMHFDVHVTSDNDFRAWVKTTGQSPKHLSKDVYNALAKPSEDNPPEYFSHVQEGLFSDAIIKYMGPMPGMTLGYHADATFGAVSLKSGDHP